jgi:hypothetical protein
MKESFFEYKSIIEKNIISVPYLYDGDVNFSTKRNYSIITNRSFILPKLIVDVIVDIYDESIENVKNKSREFIINEKDISTVSGECSLLDINKLIKQLSLELGSCPKYIFMTKKTYYKFGFDNLLFDDERLFPEYFYPITKLTYLNKNIYILYSPLIECTDDDNYILYVLDKSFQSIVYSIQNMSYNIRIFNDDIKKNNRNHKTEWIHEIDYNFYDCNFTALKVVIKNIKKIRENKINLLLNSDNEKNLIKI